MVGRRLPRFVAGLAFAAFAGVREAGAVVGSTVDAAPFADSVVMVLSRGAEGSGFCTGVVLSPRIVLTAAHCLRAPTDTLVHFRDAAGEPVLVPVVATAIHPLYRVDAAKRRVVSIDVGLARTATPLPFRAAVLADGEGPSIDAPATVVGFGLGREGDAKTGGVARAAVLRVRAPLSKVLLWAADPAEAGAGACSGDSGGPIFAADRETVVAVVAWTSGAKGSKCGLLTQGPLVAPLRGWIDSVLARWGP